MPSIINTSRFAIVGLGQLGGSLALRLRELTCIDVFGCARREESLKAARERGMIDAGSTQAEAVLPVVDMTFLCLPLDATVAFVKANLAHFRFGSIVTDVGSVKGPVVRELRELLYAKGVYFVGSHPMAGSEKCGLEAARADLFKDAVVFLTPTPEDDEEALALVADIWRDLGAIPIELSAERHDAAVAAASHAPHLLAAAIARAVLGRGDREAQSLAGAGAFRDMTRIAASQPAMCAEICRHNRGPVLAALDAFSAELAAARALLESGDDAGLTAFFTEARTLRDRWFTEFGPGRKPPTGLSPVLEQPPAESVSAALSAPAAATPNASPS